MNGRYYGIIDVVHLDVRKLESLDIERFKNNIKALGYSGEPFLNEFGFCPHIIAAIADDGELFIDNTNSGNYSAHTRNNHVIDCSTTDEFIEKLAALTGNTSKKKTTSTLTESGTLF